MFIDTISVQTIADVRLVISEARSVNKQSIIVALTKDDAPNCLSAVGFPRLYFNQLRIMKRHIDSTVLDVVHNAITGLNFNRRTLQKQLDWKDWLAAELIKLYKYDNQSMFGPPSTAPIDTYVVFWVWLYSFKPHKNNRKKVRGVCNVSTHGGKTMVHGATYAPTPQQIYFCLHIALSVLLSMYLRNAGVTNAFAEAERPEQMYCMRCDQVFKDRWKTQYPDIQLHPDAVPVLKNLQGHPEGPRL
jgi:hypothetical protein